MIAHLVVSRVAVFWKHPTLKKLGITWEDYVKERIMLYNTITKPSVAAQTDQNFFLISLVDEHINEVYPYLDDYWLDNERIAYVERNPEGLPHKNIVETVKQAVYELGLMGYTDVIVSRLDSDDLIHTDYVKNVKELLTLPNTFVDIADSYTYNLETGRVYQSGKYQKVVSPFVSVREKVEGFSAVSFAVDHNRVPEICHGFKSNEIKAIQVIHNNNMINKQGAQDITDNFPFEKYGMYFS